MFRTTSLILLCLVSSAVAQQPLPNSQTVVNVAGHWIISAKNWNGTLDTKTVDLEQKGNVITGHFKGPNQSGGLEGSINNHHIVFRTKTRTPLSFGGQVNGNTMEGTFHVRGREGQFHAERTGGQ